MKKTVIALVVWFLFLMAISVNQVLAQVAQKDNDAGKPIPSEVKIIFEKSCPGCHTEPGNTKALSHINFSKWDNYSPEIQAAKAIEICNFVTKKQIEDEKLKKERPANAPTSSEIKTICDWAQSLQAPDK